MDEVINGEQTTDAKSPTLGINSSSQDKNPKLVFFKEIDSQILDLKEKYENQEKKLQKLEDSVKDATKFQTALEYFAKAEKDSDKKLQYEIQNMQNFVMVSKREIIEFFDGELVKMQSQISELKGFFYEKYENQDKKLEATVKELTKCKTALDNLTTEKKVTDKILQNLQNSVKNSQSEIIKSFDDELIKINSQISELKGFFYEKYENQEKKLEDAYKKIANYETALNYVKQEKENLVHDKDEQIHNLDYSSKEKDRSIKELQDEIKEKQNFIMTLSNENTNLSKKLSYKESVCETIGNEYDLLKTENSELKANFENCKKEVGELKLSYTKESEKIKTEFNSLKTKVKNYETLKIDKLERAYSIFSSFKERTRNNLRAVFETDSFFGFISNGMQWERIAGIWEQAKRKIVNDDSEDLSELRELFLILFEIYNAAYIEAPYSLIIPTLGSNYNSNEQLIKNQKSDGKITAVLLEGYIFKKNNTVHKSMIEVE